MKRNAEFNEQENESIICVRMGIEKFIPQDHFLSILGKPCLVMPNGDPLDGCFYDTLTLIIDSYNHEHVHVVPNQTNAQLPHHQHDKLTYAFGLKNLSL